MIACPKNEHRGALTPEPAPRPLAKANAAERALPAERAVLECPVQQKQVGNGARPDLELFKKLVRCKKGEKPAEEGSEGAVTVDVTSMQVGTPRPWSYRQDQGSGKVGTSVYPAKTTYTIKTLYRAATEWRPTGFA